MKNASATNDKSRKRAKKPLGKPRRPLSAYNLFFRNERKKILLEQGVTEEGGSNGGREGRPRVGFANLANIVSKRWKSIDPAYKEELEREAKLEKIKYKKNVTAWELNMPEGREADTDHEGEDSPPEVVDLNGMGQGHQQSDESMWGANFVEWDASFPYGIEPPTPIGSNTNTNGALVHLFPTSFFRSPNMTNMHFNPITTSPQTSQGRIDAAPFFNIHPPFRVQKNMPGFCMPVAPQGSLLNNDEMQYPLAGRRNSMPSATTNSSMPGGVMMKNDRTQSLFSSVREREHEITHTGVHEPPIEEIQRFFNIDPESNKVEAPKHGRCNSCMY